MHEGFQRELNRLRLNAAKTLIEAHAKSDNSIGAGALEPVRLSAEVGIYMFYCFYTAIPVQRETCMIVYF